MPFQKQPNISAALIRNTPYALTRHESDEDGSAVFLAVDEWSQASISVQIAPSGYTSLSIFNFKLKEHTQFPINFDTNNWEKELIQLVKFFA